MACSVRLKLIALLVLVSGCLTLRAQECPKDNPDGPFDSASRPLTGRVVFHDEIRQWFELVLDSPTCGQSAVQLLQGGGSFEVDEGNARAIEVFRGCHVSVEGSLGIPGTGYYSAAIYLNADKITPNKDCSLQPPFPDYSKVKPDRSVRTYRVSMKLDYTGRDTIEINARSGARLLKPWQAYSSYMLTGGFAFYGYCADGYDMSRLRGTPEAKPWVVDNYAAMDPETAAAKHIRWVAIEFTCSRERRTTGHRASQ